QARSTSPTPRSGHPPSARHRRAAPTRPRRTHSPRAAGAQDAPRPAATICPSPLVVDEGVGVCPAATVGTQRSGSVGSRRAHPHPARAATFATPPARSVPLDLVDDVPHLPPRHVPLEVVQEQRERSAVVV